MSPFSISSSSCRRLTASGNEAIQWRSSSLPWIGGKGKSCPISDPIERISARSIRFLSSRMLPGKSYRFSFSSPAVLMARAGIFSSREISRQNNSHSPGMSSRRLRKGARAMGTTASRQYRSCRNAPCLTLSSRSRCVATSTLTSRFEVLWIPRAEPFRPRVP